VGRCHNILFYDPYLIIGLILIIMAVSIAMKQKLQFTGILAPSSGLIAIYYGANAYMDKMASSPITMLGLYISSGLTGVFTFPTTLIYDMLPGKAKVSKLWTVVLVIFWIGLAVAAVLAALTAIEAVPQHLLSAP
jgi:putative membrane protein